MMLNTLVGNINRKGGTLMGGGGFRDAGVGPRYDLQNFPGAVKFSGTPVGRNVPYERSAEFAQKKAAGSGYPAQAPWYPNAPQLATEWFSATVNNYPYALKALFLWSTNPVYGIPGLRGAALQALADPKRLPLLVAIDPFINETSAYADYIVPDALLYESWGWAAPWSGVTTRCTTARWPVMAPATGLTADGQPIGVESFFIALAKAMSLPGFGSDAIADMDGARYPLDKAEDWYLRGGANIAFAGKAPVPPATDEDLLLSGVERLRDPLQRTLKPDEWRQVAALYTRGGRFQSLSEAFAEAQPEFAAQRFSKALNVYHEPLGTSRNSMTGKRWPGVPAWTPAAFADGTLVRTRYNEKDWPFLMMSFKSPLQSAYSLGAARLRSLRPANALALNPADARRLGLADGDSALLSTPAGSRKVAVEVREGVMPGVLAVEHGFGHRELGARSHRIGKLMQPVVDAWLPASTSTTWAWQTRHGQARRSGWTRYQAVRCATGSRRPCRRLESLVRPLRGGQHRQQQRGQFGGRVRLHLFQHMLAVHLHGLGADAQRQRNHAVGLAAGHAQSHFLLARGELFELSVHRVMRSACPQRRDAAAHGLGNGIEQCLVAERLFQELDRPLLHGLHRQRHVGMPGDEDDRQLDASLLHRALQLQATHRGHAHVQHQATRWLRASLQEALGAFKGLHAPAH
jgi:anaerobic selenocysteine-containing dehydrogenase